MKKLLAGSLIATLPFIVGTTYAETVTSGNASSTVEVNNQVNSTNNATSTTHTHITVNTGNGDQTYDSDQGGNVNVTSHNGQTTITVNGKTQQMTNNNTTNDQPTTTNSPTVKPTSNQKQKSEVAVHKTANPGGIVLFFNAFVALLHHLL